MAKLKVRLMFNHGRRGAPMAKLGKIAEQAEKFLRSLAADCQVESKSGEWLAVEFENGSVSYDAELQGDVTPAIARRFATNLERLADYDPGAGGLNVAISAVTALEYARIADLIDPDESIGLGIYDGDANNPAWREITSSRTLSLRGELETPLPSYGAVQGILHSWMKEAGEPHFQLRELSTDALVKVIYPPALYAEVARAVQERSTVLIVSGEMLCDRSTRSAIELKADKIERVGGLSSAEFEAFFGSAPNFVAEDAEVDG